VVEEPLYGTVNRVHLVTGRAFGTPCGGLLLMLGWGLLAAFGLRDYHAADS